MHASPHACTVPKRNPSKAGRQLLQATGRTNAYTRRRKGWQRFATPTHAGLRKRLAHIALTIHIILSQINGFSDTTGTLANASKTLASQVAWVDAWPLSKVACADAWPLVVLSRPKTRWELVGVQSNESRISFKVTFMPRLELELDIRCVLLVA